MDEDLRKFTIEQAVKVAFIDAAGRNTEDMGQQVVEIAAKIENYIKNGKQEDSK